MGRRCLRSLALFLGFGLYLLLAAGLHIMLFRQYAGMVAGGAQLALIPFGPLTAALAPAGMVSMTGTMWLQLMGIMVPFGFCLFLWVEDCICFRSIAALTLSFSGVLAAGNYIFYAHVFNVDFMIASLIGSYLGYRTAVGLVGLLFGKRLQPMLTSAAGRKSA